MAFESDIEHDSDADALGSDDETSATSGEESEYEALSNSDSDDTDTDGESVVLSDDMSDHYEDATLHDDTASDDDSVAGSDDPDYEAPAMSDGSDDEASAPSVGSADEGADDRTACHKVAEVLRMSVDDLLSLRGAVEVTAQTEGQVDCRIDIDSVVALGAPEHLIQQMELLHSILHVDCKEYGLSRSHLKLDGRWVHTYESRKLGSLQALGVGLQLDVYLIRPEDDDRVFDKVLTEMKHFQNQSLSAECVREIFEERGSHIKVYLQCHDMKDVTAREDLCGIAEALKLMAQCCSQFPEQHVDVAATFSAEQGGTLLLKQNSEVAGDLNNIMRRRPLVTNVGGLKDYVNINSSNYADNDVVLRVNSYWRYPRKILLNSAGQDLLLTAQKSVWALPESTTSFEAASSPATLRKLLARPVEKIKELRENMRAVSGISGEYRIELGSRIQHVGVLLEKLLDLGRKALATQAFCLGGPEVTQLVQRFVTAYTEPLLKLVEEGNFTMERRRFAGLALDALRLYLTGSRRFTYWLFGRADDCVRVFAAALSDTVCPHSAIAKWCSAARFPRWKTSVLFWSARGRLCAPKSERKVFTAYGEISEVKLLLAQRCRRPGKAEEGFAVVIRCAQLSLPISASTMHDATPDQQLTVLTREVLHADDHRSNVRFKRSASDLHTLMVEVCQACPLRTTRAMARHVLLSLCRDFTVDRAREAIRKVLVDANITEVCLPVRISGDRVSVRPAHVAASPAEPAAAAAGGSAAAAGLKIFGRRLLSGAKPYLSNSITDLEKICYLQAYLDISAKYEANEAPHTDVPFCSVSLNVDPFNNKCLLRSKSSIASFFRRLFKDTENTVSKRKELVTATLQKMAGGMNVVEVRNLALAGLRSICSKVVVDDKTRENDIRRLFVSLFQQGLTRGAAPSADAATALAPRAAAASAPAFMQHGTVSSSLDGTAATQRTDVMWSVKLPLLYTYIPVMCCYGGSFQQLQEVAEFFVKHKPELPSIAYFPRPGSRVPHDPKERVFQSTRAILQPLVDRGEIHVADVEFHIKYSDLRRDKQDPLHLLLKEALEEEGWSPDRLVLFLEDTSFAEQTRSKYEMKIRATREYAPTAVVMFAARSRMVRLLILVEHAWKMVSFVSEQQGLEITDLDVAGTTRFVTEGSELSVMWSSPYDFIPLMVYYSRIGSADEMQYSAAFNVLLRVSAQVPEDTNALPAFVDTVESDTSAATPERYDDVPAHLVNSPGGIDSCARDESPKFDRSSLPLAIRNTLFSETPGQLIFRRNSLGAAQPQFSPLSADLEVHSPLPDSDDNESLSTPPYYPTPEDVSTNTDMSTVVDTATPTGKIARPCQHNGCADKARDKSFYCNRHRHQRYDRAYQECPVCHKLILSKSAKRHQSSHSTDRPPRTLPNFG